MNHLLQELYRFANNFGKRYLSIGDERDDDAATIAAIRNGITFKGANLWVLVFATFIASLGLNVNSTAVIIGAMLISPLMGPIMGVGLGLGINDFELIKKSLYNLAVATTFSIITSTLYFAISPLNEARSELLARTTPTIYDVLIAFFGGLAGIVAMSTKLKGNVIPGVAIATALMPPLCTAGFGLATGNIQYFLGAFYLYLINSMFISLATFIGVSSMKFQKKEFIDKVREKRVKRIVSIAILITIVPSIIITYNMVKLSLNETRAQEFINRECSWDNTQIIQHSIDMTSAKKSITLTIVGENLTDREIATAKDNLEDYHLQGVALNIRHGLGDNGRLKEKEMNMNGGLVFERIYQENKQQITQQQREITSLNDKLKEVQVYDSLGVAITPEVSTLFPQVKQIALATMIAGNIPTYTTDTLTVALISTATPLSQNDREKLKEWLTLRCRVKELKLVVEKL